MNDRENWLRAVRFERPERIPISFHINGACWQHYPQEALHDLMEAHPLLFPGYVRPSEPVRPDFAPWQRADAPYTDSWGCVWQTAENGITGAVVAHPLADWDALATYEAPDPDHDMGWGPIDWAQVAAGFRQAEADERLRRGGLRHGHTFLTLQYIRGYENLIYDMVDEDPRLWKLVEMVEAFNLALVRHYLDAGAEMMGYPEDLGMQVGPMLSPAQFRTWIQPSYARLMAPALDAGCVIHMHSDGDIRDLVDDLLPAGVHALNLQDRVNGIDWIAGRLKGKICIDLDIDRQEVTRFGTPEAIDTLIRTAVETLGSPEGGLMMIYGLYPGVPLENVSALMDALERYAPHFA